MTFQSRKNTSFRNDRPEFSFSTQIITCCAFLGKLLLFSEPLFSHLNKVRLKQQRQQQKLSSRIVTRMRSTLSTLDAVNAQETTVKAYSCLYSLLCRFLCWWNGGHILNELPSVALSFGIQEGTVWNICSYLYSSFQLRVLSPTSVEMKSNSSHK